MSRNFLLFLVFIIISNTTFSQQSLNDYKYVIVPKKYDFLKYEDQYQLNSLTKFLFKKEGFITLFDTDRKSEELANNPCLGLISIVKNNDGLFNTKLVIELINCKNEVVYTSDEGKSKQKEYKKAYHEALRNAFKSLTLLKYKYKPTKKSLIENKVEVVVEKEEPIEAVEEVIPVKVETEEKKPVVIVKEILPVEVVEEEVEDAPFLIIEEATATNLLYAQVNSLGFQLVDSTPKVVYVLLKSTKKDLYYLKNKNGILYKENRYWIIEYYDLDTLVRKNLNIKF